MKNGITTEDTEGVKGYKTRKILAQIVIAFSIDWQFFALGAAISYGPVQVSGLSKGEDIIQASSEELSWIGSLCFIMQAIGNLFGGPITAWIGRKRAMLLGNVPYVMAWILMWQSKNIVVLLIGNALLGLGTGLNCAPMVSYLGEFCEPSIRGILASSSEMFVAMGTCGVFVFGTVFDWRITAVIYLGTSIFATLIIFVIPETPIWLLSKGREKEAMRSLCIARGLVKPEVVQKEFDDLLAYNKNNMRCRKCEKKGISSVDNPVQCPHGNESYTKRFKAFMAQLVKREARRPLILATSFFLFSGFTGFTSIKPTMVNLLTAFNVAMDAKWTMIYVGVATVLGALICMSLVKIIGKRPIAIGAMLGSSISIILMGVYAHYHIPPEISSYGEVPFVEGEASILPLILFIIMVICNTVGVIPITWMIISEIFPYNVRGLCCGFVGAMCDVSFFLGAKTYLAVETTMHIYGALYFYGIITFIGAVYLYLFMIETEGKSHALIEATFADKNNVIYADDFIARKIKSIYRKKTITNTNPKDISNDDKKAYSNDAYDDDTHS